MATPTPEQRAAIAYARDQQRNLAVHACAGSGKSWTLVEMIKAYAMRRRTLAVAFNKSIAEELKTRVPRHVDVKTLHGLGFATLQRAWSRRLEIDGRRERMLIRGVVPAHLNNHKAICGGVAKLVAMCMCELSLTPEAINRTMSRYGVLPEPGVPRELYVTWAGTVLALAREETAAVSYDDMVFLPAVEEMRTGAYDAVFFDEAQDANPAQVRLIVNAIKPGGKIVIVGDSHQCHPTGTRVRTPDGDRPIETLRPGDPVVGWDGVHGAPTIEHVRTTVGRSYRGDVYVLVANGCTVAMTPEHRVPAWFSETLFDMQARVDGLCEGWEVCVADETPRRVPIARLTRRPFTGVVHSLEVSGNHYYVADGVVVHNSIYQWRGAGANAFHDLVAEIGAEVLPLTVTFRCPERVCELARTLVPDFWACEGAPRGRVTWRSEDEMYERIQPGETVISRTNAALTRACMRLLRRGVRARVAGRAIGEQLGQLVERSGAVDVKRLLTWLGPYVTEESARLTAAGSDDQAAELVDAADALRELTQGLTSVAPLRAKLDDLFVDEPGTQFVSLRSTHKAKGLQWGRVWMLESTYKLGTEEGANLYYVAATRAAWSKEDEGELALVQLPRADGSVPPSLAEDLLGPEVFARWEAEDAERT